MPRKHRMTKRRHRAWTISQETQLLTGFGWPVPDEPFYLTNRPTAAGMAAAKEAWAELAGELMANWIEKHPGTRPFMWWAVDARERRLPTDGLPHPFDSPERQAHVAKIAVTLTGKVRQKYLDEAVRLHHGVPACWIVEGDFSRTYETEEAYLRRLDLLTPREETLLSEAKVV